MWFIDRQQYFRLVEWEEILSEQAGVDEAGSSLTPLLLWEDGGF